MNLDAIQREKVGGIVKEIYSDIHIVRMQYRPQIDAILEKRRSEIKSMLRADQIETYDKMIAQIKAKAKNNQKLRE